MGKVIATNKKAYRDYSIFETLEAGISLKGGEVQSFRAAKVVLDDSFARVDDGQVLLYNMNISQYTEASYLNVPEKRPRILLLHKKEIEKLSARVDHTGFTIVPLKAYFNDRGFVKLTLSICKGKKQYDKRDDIKKREVDMKIKRAIRNRGR
jgi:SsrA-binding protein